MTLKRITILLLIALFALGLAACELSASTPPPPSPTSGGGMSTLEVELGNIATQTAAAGGSSGVPTTTPTTAPEETDETTEATEPPTATPEPEQPAVTVPPPTPGLPATYTIQKGEFPFCIARRFNVNQNELLSLNGLSLNSKVRTGITLKIPQTGNLFSGVRSLRPHPATYTVNAGDTIYTVACYYGSVSPDAIVQANNLTSPYALTTGQTLQIP
jgi:LysM repeat protein